MILLYFLLVFKCSRLLVLARGIISIFKYKYIFGLSISLFSVDSDTLYFPLCVVCKASETQLGYTGNRM